VLGRPFLDEIPQHADVDRLEWQLQRRDGVRIDRSTAPEIAVMISNLRRAQLNTRPSNPST
jgi:hypothetical protein